MEDYCKICDSEEYLESEGFSEATCMKCGAVYETEMEYIDYDNIAVWIVGLTGFTLRRV